MDICLLQIQIFMEEFHMLLTLTSLYNVIHVSQMCFTSEELSFGSELMQLRHHQPCSLPSFPLPSVADGRGEFEARGRPMDGV